MLVVDRTSEVLVGLTLVMGQTVVYTGMISVVVEPRGQLVTVGRQLETVPVLVL